MHCTSHPRPDSSDLQSVVTYDARMGTAAIAYGLQVATPGGSGQLQR